MQCTNAADRLSQLYMACFGSAPGTVTTITAAGSPRVYCRLSSAGRPDYIGTVGTNPAENRAFRELSRHFAKAGLPVPRVIAASIDGMAYLQTDAGNRALFDLLGTPDAEPLLHEAMRMLARIQTLGARGLDWSVCFPQPAFDERTVRFDLNYFKYCFLKVAGVAFDEMALQDDFDRMERTLLDGAAEWNTFMYRDFQSRNVMVDDHGRLTAIDFQGGRRGPREYDLASFLWQAKAGFGPDPRERLLDTYLDETALLDPTADSASIRRRLPLFVLFRVLQTLGAYGFRGLIERRPHFLSSLELGKANLSALFAATPEFAGAYPELKRISDNLTDSSDNAD